MARLISILFWILKKKFCTKNRHRIMQTNSTRFIEHFVSVTHNLPVFTSLSPVVRGRSLAINNHLDPRPLFPADPHHSHPLGICFQISFSGVVWETSLFPGGSAPATHLVMATHICSQDTTVADKPLAPARVSRK